MHCSCCSRAVSTPTQVNVGNKYNRDAGLSDSCLSRQGDFQTLPFEDGEFDAAYQIEATCHSPNKVKAPTTIPTLLLSKTAQYFASTQGTWSRL